MELSHEIRIKFQFQTVRLQAGTSTVPPLILTCFNSKRYDYRWCSCTSIPSLKGVSIPNGTITGICTGQTQTRFFWFQFQTVRLQEKLSLTCSVSKISFNSKRYDYRRTGHNRLNKGFLRFNSKRYDYRVTAIVVWPYDIKVSIPNGTITGISSNASSKGFIGFQFQTVRLQETVTEKMPADGFSFNSKRYDYRQ